MPPHTQPAFAIDDIRAQFPALALEDGGRQRSYLDNPAGTQVPQRVIDRTIEALATKNANLGGFFTTSRAAGELVEEAHRAVADLYGAAPAEIIFGQNMTTLTLQMSRCLGRRFRKGDELVLSRMDHDANVAPWLLLAEDLDLTVRWMDFDPEAYEFPDDALRKVLTERTRLVAIGQASNCTGTINDVTRFCAEARAAGAISYVDAVQFAPHACIDVKAIGCDFLVSSAYKWYGPHMGMLYGRKEVLEDCFSYRVRPAGDELPHKFETGTLSHEGLAGCLGAVEYLASLGVGQGRREQLQTAWDAIGAYEQALTLQLIEGLLPFKGLIIRGITSANAMHRRVPTVSFTVDGVDPADLARHFAQENIFVWSGHNYAVEPCARMGLLEKGGVLRVGLAHYNTAAEVDGFIRSLHRALN